MLEMVTLLCWVIEFAHQPSGPGNNEDPQPNAMAPSSIMHARGWILRASDAALFDREVLQEFADPSRGRHSSTTDKHGAQLDSTNPGHGPAPDCVHVNSTAGCAWNQRRRFREWDEIRRNVHRSPLVGFTVAACSELYLQHA